MLLCHNLAECQPSITEVSEQQRAQFTHKWEAVASRGRFCRGEPRNFAKFSVENCALLMTHSIAV